MEKRLKTVTAIIMLVVIAVSTTGCATAVKAGDLMKGVQKRATSVFANREAYASGMSDFAVRLAKTCNERDTGKNVLVSPLFPMYSKRWGCRVHLTETTHSLATSGSQITTFI